MTLPDIAAFQAICAKGLSSIRPLKDAAIADDEGWLFKTNYPPSYQAYGRMRALMALQEIVRLKPQRFLEIAAGDGALSACVELTGCEVFANDLREVQLKEALSAYTNGQRIRVVGGSLFDLDTAQLGKFDVIAACEIIEHVAHPDRMLGHLRKLLTPNGHLLLTTPNGAYIHSRLPTYAEIKDFSELEQLQFKPDADGHLFAFTPEELTMVAARAGFQIEHLQVWGTPLLTGHYGLRFLSSAPLCRTAHLIERLAQHLPGRKRFCFSLSAVLRPNSS